MCVLSEAVTPGLALASSGHGQAAVGAESPVLTSGPDPGQPKGMGTNTKGQKPPSPSGQGQAMVVSALPVQCVGPALSLGTVSDSLHSWHEKQGTQPTLQQK